MKLVYFARLREQIGHAEEHVTLPSQVRDVAGLMIWLRSRGEPYASALKDQHLVRIAVNEAYATASHAIGPDDEIALFPPVTGGLS